MPIDRFSPKIPFIIGESLHKNIPAGRQSSLMLSAGRWSLSPRATIPFATVEAPGYGAREISWGQQIEIPDGSQGIVINSSAHQGDAIFDACGTGRGFANEPPACITTPAVITTINNIIPIVLRSGLLDTRRARRAYLCCTSLNTVTANPIVVKIYYQPGNRGFTFPPGSPAAIDGFQTYTITTVGYKGQIPLGMGSGQNREPAPGLNSLAELRPMALLNSLFIEVLESDQGGLNGTDAYFLLEY